MQEEMMPVAFIEKEIERLKSIRSKVEINSVSYASYSCYISALTALIEKLREKQ